MDADVREMATRSFGYGRWDAPYWFIGPEQGQGRVEENDLKQRVKAWSLFGKYELDDCRAFHAQIRATRWHRDKPALQPTWRPLMILLMAFLGKSTDNEALRTYQRDRWGSRSGETCVIELSGLAASSLKVERPREIFREERIKVIKQRMGENQPKLVVMYGVGELDAWKEISGCAFEKPGIEKRGSTIFSLHQHPVAPGLKNSQWEQAGIELRELALAPVNSREIQPGTDLSSACGRGSWYVKFRSFNIHFCCPGKDP